MKSKLRDFVRMNPPILGSNVEEDPQAFLYDVYNIIHAMGMTSKKKVDLFPHLLK